MIVGSLTHTQIYVYIYIYTNFVEHNRHFLSTYFLVDPFILTYCFYRIRRELIHAFSIIVYIPSTFCPTLCHYQGRVYYKSIYIDWERERAFIVLYSVISCYTSNQPLHHFSRLSFCLMNIIYVRCNVNHVK